MWLYSGDWGEVKHWDLRLSAPGIGLLMGGGSAPPGEQYTFS